MKKLTTKRFCGKKILVKNCFVKYSSQSRDGQLFWLAVRVFNNFLPVHIAKLNINFPQSTLLFGVPNVLFKYSFCLTTVFYQLDNENILFLVLVKCAWLHKPVLEEKIKNNCSGKVFCEIPLHICISFRFKDFAEMHCYAQIYNTSNR